jgi:hypothetical protein
VSDLYGRPIAFYDLAPPGGNVQSPVSLKAPLPMMSEQQKNVGIHNLVKDVPPAVREDFMELFNAWKKTWFAGTMALSSNSRARGNTYTYHKLLEMGPEIIPLVVEQLNKPGNFIAVQLYEDLQTDPAQRTALAATKPQPHLGLQGQAKNIIEQHLKARS